MYEIITDETWDKIKKMTDNAAQQGTPIRQYLINILRIIGAWDDDEPKTQEELDLRLLAFEHNPEAIGARFKRLAKLALENGKLKAIIDDQDQILAKMLGFLSDAEIYLDHHLDCRIYIDAITCDCKMGEMEKRRLSLIKRISQEE